MATTASSNFASTSDASSSTSSIRHSLPVKMQSTSTTSSSSTPILDQNPVSTLPRINPSSLTTNSKPIRKIFTESDMALWTRSRTYRWLETLIQRLTVAVQDLKIDDFKIEQEKCSKFDSPVHKIVEYLDKAHDWIDEIPLESAPQRFGNKSFRLWLQKIEETETDFQRSLLGSTRSAALAELSHHFSVSFGSGPRLDYGTGHELSFLAYLLILRLIGVLEESDERSIVLTIFVSYLRVVRKLQKVFRLEPAGSKGVWGLDDHQHLVYLWGASQLKSHPLLRPSSILTPTSLEPHSHSYLFLSSILHVNDLKSGPFAEHSPMLHTIATTVPNWAKVTSGLLKMYRAEVLGKLPVVQHFWFGQILPWKDAETGEAMESSGDGMDDDEKVLKDDSDDKRERDEGTVAPWNLPTGSFSSSHGKNGGLERAQTTSSLPAYTSSGPSLGFQRQQAPTQAPRSFAPPVLFPSRTLPSTTIPRTTTTTSSSSAAAAKSNAPRLRDPFEIEQVEEDTSDLRRGQ